MSLAGYLSEYSLAEILHFVQDGNKSGLLSIEPEPNPNRQIASRYYLGFQAGRLVYLVTGNESTPSGSALLKMAEQRRWVNEEQVAGIASQVSFLPQPLGTYLKSRNLLNSEQLTLLFNGHVVAATCKLFEIQQGKFSFDPQAALANSEMTGLSMPANEMALLGLRTLKDWSGLTSKLPAPEVALQRFSADPNGLRLDSSEWQVWQLALGEKSIANIAKQTNLSVNKVQQIGFRLSTIGLLHEVTAEVVQPTVDRLANAPKPTIGVGGGSAATPVSASFLGNLMGFLKKKG